MNPEAGVKLNIEAQALYMENPELKIKNLIN